MVDKTYIKVHEDEGIEPFIMANESQTVNLKRKVTSGKLTIKATSAQDNEKCTIIVRYRKI